MALRVLSVASEAVPLVKTGGLADVAGALPAAVAPHGIAMTTLLPGYPAVMAAIGKAKRLHTWDALLGEPARLLSGKIGNDPLLVLDAPGYFGRAGNPYTDAAGKDWDDNWRRFAALGRAAADIASGAVPALSFDVLHAHDWQAAMAIAYLRFAPFRSEPRIPAVMTIHNMAFQGWFDRPSLRQPRTAGIGMVDRRGGNLWRRGFPEIGSATRRHDHDRQPDLCAVRSSARNSAWVWKGWSHCAAIGSAASSMASTPPNGAPKATRRWPCVTPRGALGKRTANKRTLEQHFGLDEGDGPLFIMVSRLTWQKGADLIPEVLDHLVGNGGRLAVLGSGDPAIIAALQDGAVRHPGKVGLQFGYDEALSHRMQGGGDAILVPSRFEPCGLTQLYGLAYGCVPVVSRTGGLSDTVIDANPAALAAGVATGVQFDGAHYHGLASAISRTIALYGQATSVAADSAQRHGR